MASHNFSTIYNCYAFLIILVILAATRKSNESTFMAFGFTHTSVVKVHLAGNIPSTTRILHTQELVGASASALAAQATIKNSNELARNHDTTSHEDDPPIFEMISDLAVSTLYQSDLKRDAKGKQSGAQGSSATNWIDDATSFALKNALDKMQVTLPEDIEGLERDEAIAWLRWMKASPTPLIVDLTQDLLQCAKIHDQSNGITNEDLADLNTNRENFYSRISCKLITLPSGAELIHPQLERTGTIVFGKLLYGGVSRYRLLGSSTSNRPPRRVGEHTAIKSSSGEDVNSWVQFGGTERKYQAVDMGPCAIFEISLSGKKEEPDTHGNDKGREGEMKLMRIDWSPLKMFSYSPRSGNGLNGSINGDDKEDDSDKLMGNSAMNLGGRKRNEAFSNDFKSAVGGLNDQIEIIVRRVLDGRVIRPVEEDSASTSTIASAGADSSESDDGSSLVEMTDGELNQAALEADELALLGLTPVRGLLLYGPPGCGKTALAREISRALRARSPKILAAPELLDRWVGSSEKLIRQLFADAEAELAACNGDATKSALHVIVIDEIDAVFRKRTSAEDSGEATRSSAVNQILSKLDGVNAIPNVLLIGMTNRRELLDPALLRPGRLEVQVLVPKPDAEGRREILNIHFDALRKKGRLSRPLCCAIDGVRYKEGIDEITDLGISTEKALRKRDKLKNIIRNATPLSGRYFDLAAASTNGYSGADLAGLVRCAGSLALARTRKAGSGIDELFITLDDVKNALKEVQL
jgi:vesicle-fusing ATPase